MMRLQKPATLESAARREECRNLLLSEIQREVESVLHQHNIDPYTVEVTIEPVVEGALFDLSGQRPGWPDGDAYAWCYVAFVNPMEGRDYKWAHPAWFVFVPAMGEGETLVAPHDFPPHHNAPTKHPLNWVYIQEAEPLS